MNKNLTSVFLIIYLFFNALPAQNDTLYVLSNLNGALVDCQCSDTLNGGFSRFLSFKLKHQGGLYILNGDFLTSYPYPEFNEFILKLVTENHFRLIVAGDQEFIHPIFEETLSKDSIFRKQTLLPVTPSHFNYRIIEGKAYSYLCFLVFDVDSLRSRTEEIIEKAGNYLQSQMGDQVRFLMFFHGDWERASNYLSRFPWIDGVIVGHSMERRVLLNKKNQFLISAGSEGEALGKIIFMKPSGNVQVELINLLNFEEHVYVLERYKAFKLKYEKGNTRD